MNVLDSFLRGTMCYSVRITSPNVTVEKVFQKFKGDCEFLVIGLEGGDEEDEPELHIQALIGSTRFEMIPPAPPGKRKKDKNASWIKEKILEIYPDAKGNKGHSVTKARKKEQLAKYCLKDGSYKTQGFSKEFLSRLIKLSFSHDTFKKRYRKLRESLSLNEISLEEYADKLLVEKVQFQDINPHHWRNHLLSVAIDIGHVTASHVNKKAWQDLNICPHNLGNCTCPTDLGYVREY